MFDSLLDVGAGEGRVTACLAPLFRGAVEATDVSRPMVWRLGRRGFTAHLTESPGSLAPSTYSVVALLNVLDRCDRPIAMLSECKVHLPAPFPHPPGPNSGSEAFLALGCRIGWSRAAGCCSPW